VTAAAAIAFSALWAPRSRISSRAIRGSPRHTSRPSASTTSAPALVALAASARRT
jgi:hypothetical protein